MSSKWFKKWVEVSNFDKKAYELIRENVSSFLTDSAKKYDRENILLLDIAPQVHEGAAAHFKRAKIETLDIDSGSGVTYIADITENNKSLIRGESFDVVVCTEVLEHTLNPFAAIEEMRRILKKGGVILASTPFNFRMHGPPPDCWRFTEEGLEILFSGFKNVEIRSLNTPDRNLMPIHYTIEAFG